MIQQTRKSFHLITIFRAWQHFQQFSDVILDSKTQAGRTAFDCTS